MKKVELMQAYEEAKKQGFIDSVTLFIHMPTGETETITNPNVEEKLKYVEKTYNDDLVHANCKDIYIEDVYFLTARDGFDFGIAINLLKQGNKMARKGWNGKGMYIFLARDFQLVTDADLSEFNPNHDEECTPENAVSVGNVLVMRTEDKKLQPGWTASQADMLAEDWMFAE